MSDEEKNELEVDSEKKSPEKSKQKGPNIDRFVADLKELMEKDPEYFIKYKDQEGDSPLKAAMKRWKMEIDERSSGVKSGAKEQVVREAKKRGYVTARISTKNVKDALRDFSLVQSVLASFGLNIRAVDTSDKALEHTLNETIKISQLGDAIDRVSNAINVRDERRPKLVSLKGRVMQTQQVFWSKCEELRKSGQNMLKSTRQATRTNKTTKKGAPEQQKKNEGAVAKE